MATIRKEFITRATIDTVWDAMRDVGALHARLVPGFVVNTVLETGTPPIRIVTFANGTVVREPIVAIDDTNRRVVWSAEGANTTHYNSSVTATATPGGTNVVWTSDFLPDTATPAIDAAMTMGSRIMKRTLDGAA